MKHLKTFESYSINEENIFKNIALSILKKIPKFKEGFENAKTKLEQDSKLKSDLEKFKDSNLKELQEIQNKIGSDLENLDFATNEEANIMGSLTKYFPKLANYGRLLTALGSLAMAFVKGTGVTGGSSAGEISVHPLWFAGFVIFLLWTMFQWIPKK
jgi:hypothetical protein